ncbi:MAG: OmpA family protein [Bacteroidota bacterium]
MVQREDAFHVKAGAGIAFRVSPRLNVGFEHAILVVVGPRADRIDGIERTNGERSAFGDIVNYPQLRLNFNLGNKSNKSEPLYWMNPLKGVMSELDAIKNRPATEIVDTDEDGVIDQLDLEPNTEKDAVVDTKGRTLDSDKDGVPDHLDLEPYYTPRPGERINSQGIVENPNIAGGVSEERVRELINEAIDQRIANGSIAYGGGAGSGTFPGGSNGGADGTGTAETGEPGADPNITNLFLPMIHFATSSATIRYSDYGTLAAIARIMKSNPQMRIAVVGHTDQTGGSDENEQLSYDRAKTVIEHFENNHGISRGRFVLLFRGQEEALVPATSSYMNRRVEFRVAAYNEVDRDPPFEGDSEGDGY